MATLGTWTLEKYGPLHQHRVAVLQISGTNLPWFLYFPGGGWARFGLEALYDDTVGEEIFRQAIWPAIGSYPVKCFSAFYSAHRYNWSTNNSTTPSTAYYSDRYPTTPSYLDSGARDGRLVVQYIRANAERFGINPDAGIVMGSSAGAQIASCVAYDVTAPYHPGPTTPIARPYRPTASSRVLAAHLKISPTDLANYRKADSSLMNLFGTEGQTEYDTVLDARRDSLCAVGLSAGIGRPVPTYGYFYESPTGTPAQDPPFQDATTTWASGQSYAVGVRRNRTISSSLRNFYCIQSHTSDGTITAPGTGSSWQSYWEEYSAAPYHHVINGQLLSAAMADRGVEYVLGHPGTVTYPSGCYDWLRAKWDPALQE